MSALILVAAVFCLGAGIVIFGMKPHRFTNRAFLITSVLAAIWLACVWAAIRVGDLQNVSLEAPVIWIRLNSVASILWTWALWNLSESITTDPHNEPLAIQRSFIWLLATVSLAAATFSDHYVTASHTDEKGVLYYLYSSLAYIALACLILRIAKYSRTNKGLRLVELRFLALPLAAGSIGVLLFTTIGNVIGSQLIRRLSFIPFVACYGISAWAITFHRLYYPREIMLLLGQFALVIATAIATTLAFLEILSDQIISKSAIMFSIAISVPIAFWIEHVTRRWFSHKNETIIADLRNSVALITRSHADPHSIINAFERMLMKKSITAFVTLLHDRGDEFAGKGVTLKKSRPAYRELCERSWETPESLERRRSTTQSDDLRDFLACNSIAAVVAVPPGGQVPSLLIAFGEKKNRWPFTFPEVERLQSIAVLIDNVLSHARLTTETALKAKMEHLAVMSRGLAHDLNNLITPVSSFLVHTEPQIVCGTAEAEVHAAAKRSVAFMRDYIREALFFAKRLSPNFEWSSIQSMLQSAFEVAAPRAKRARITVAIDGTCALAADLDRVLIQRLLVNLINNAIDASPAGSMVKVSASLSSEGLLQILVKDNGPGIPTQIRARMFEPYFTTKQFGDDVRGFGLGLTICERIVQLHRGSISVESAVGNGTTVTVSLPITHACRERKQTLARPMCGAQFTSELLPPISETRPSP